MQELEKNSDSTVDYSRLNKEIDTSATMGTGATKGFRRYQGEVLPVVSYMFLILVYIKLIKLFNTCIIYI